MSSVEPVTAPRISDSATPPRAEPSPRLPRRLRRPGNRRLGDALVLGVPCTIAAVLVFHAITARSLWIDEAATVAIASQHGGALWNAIAHDGGNMLAYYALLHVLIGLFGDGELVIRFVSAVTTIATVGILGLTARRLFDRRVALATGLLTAVSLPLVFWGQDARGYAPMLALIAGSFLALIALVDGAGREDRAPPSRWAWLAYVLTTVLAVYMSFVAALIVPAQLLALLWCRRRWRPALSAVGVIAAGCLPLVVLALSRGSGQLSWVPKPSQTQLHQMLQWLTSSGMQPNFRPTATATTLLVLSTMLVIAVLARILIGSARGSERAGSWPQVLVLCWLVVPIGLILLESSAGQPMLLFRDGLVSLPAVSLLLAWGLTDRRLPRWLVWCSIGILLALRALQLAPSYGVSPENWRAASAYVLARTQPHDCIAFYPSDGRMALAYYIGSGTAAAARAPAPVLPVAPWSLVRPYVEDYASPSSAARVSIETRCPRLWFVASHQGLRDGPPSSRSNYVRYRALLGSFTSAYARHATVSFGWASPVRVELLAR